MLVLLFALPAGEAPPLPGPACLPEHPALQPAVVTAAGRRLPLAGTDAVVEWDARHGVARVSRPGWWVVNHPFAAIRGADGRDPDQVARAITGLPRERIRNWWILTPGRDAGPEPVAAGPAPITPCVAAVEVVVDGAHAAADDAGPGTPAHPLRTIAAAVRRLAAGTVVRVMPGLYREAVAVRAEGRAEAPAVIEGVRDAEGRLPVLSGNRVLPTEAWRRESAAPGVWRADLPWDAFGTVSCDGELLAERDRVDVLQPGQVVVSRSSREFAFPRLDGTADPEPGEERDGRAWMPIAADAAGGFALPAGPAVYYLSAWVWVDPARRPTGEIFDATAPRPIGGTMGVQGFRAFRQTGSRGAAQLNQFRWWLGGAAMPGVPRPGAPGPAAGYGQDGDRVRNVPLAEGWNHLVLQLDTTTRPEAPRLALAWPRNAGAVRCSARRPAAPGRPPDGPATPFLSEALLLGPFPAVRERALYVRLVGDRDARQAVVDAAAVGEVLQVSGRHVQVRGLEIRHGGQFQQKALVTLAGPGVLLEGCLVRAAEWNAVNAALQGSAAWEAPLTVRGNWILDPGGLGLGAVGDGARDAGLAAPTGRPRLVVEWNRIAGANRLGNDRWWESGAMKLLRTTGAIVRSNDLQGGDGPGIWFDWENAGCRIEGNRSTGVVGFLAGIEASPGPMVVGANLAVGTRPGGVWFRQAILAWSSAQVWAVNNTVDGGWNAEDARWQGQDGADGICLGEGADDRGTAWGRLPHRRQAILNNLITGCDAGITRSGAADAVAGNRADTARRDPPRRFRDPGRGDYRLGEDAVAAGLAGGEAAAPEAAQVRYDHLGLPFANGEGRAIGAFRCERPLPPGTAMVVEVETVDGRFLRLTR